MTGMTGIDLAARSLGGSVMAASDESFGEKENLLIPAVTGFVPGRYGHKGELVDGWETRRHGPGRDWALVRLGAPGIITSLDVDTTSFAGNHPAACRIEACEAEGYPGVAELARLPWIELAGPTALDGDAHNVIPVEGSPRVTHLRLWIEPDGGVARLRAYGRAVPDPRLFDGVTVDLAARHLGGLVESSSDEFYSPAQALNAPGPARSMGEGWETRRRRDGGHDWAVVRLCAPGIPRQVEIDTSYFVANASTAFALYGGDGTADWHPLLPRTPLLPDTRHLFHLDSAPLITHVRLDAFPDGGIARLRVHGTAHPPPRAWSGSGFPPTADVRAAGSTRRSAPN